MRGRLFLYLEFGKGGERNGTMVKFNTGNRISDFRIILSIAPARNKTRCDTRCTDLDKSEINFI